MMQAFNVLFLVIFHLIFMCYAFTINEGGLMDALKTKTRQDLLNDLAFQYPVSVASFSNCIGCTEHKSRGGWYCKECIKKELLERGLNEDRLGDLIGKLKDAQIIHQEVRDLAYALSVGKK